MRLVPTFNCKKIIQDLQKGGFDARRAQDKVFEQFFHPCINFHKRKFPGLDHEEVKDAYIEAVLAFIHKVEEGTFDYKTSNSCKAFIYKVCKYKCIDTWKRKSSKEEELLIDPPQISLPEDPYYELKLRAFGRLKERCREILRLDGEGYSRQEILEIMGYANIDTVYATIHNCRKNLKEIWNNMLEQLSKEDSNEDIEDKDENLGDTADENEDQDK